MEYLRHATTASGNGLDPASVYGLKPLLARIYRPVGTKAIAALVDVHGGAWVSGDRTQQEVLDRALAANGILVVAVDFRQPPGNPYSTSLQDINYAIRWLKLHAPELGAAPGAQIGAMGSSSGGHLVILSAMRPHDPRYAALELPGGAGLDARLDFVIADAPATDPHAFLALTQGDNPYWNPPTTALEGNPHLILKRNEPAEFPPLLITHGTSDATVPLEMTREFVARYRAAGGDAQLLTFDGMGHAFVLQYPRRAESAQQAQAVLAFIHKRGVER